MCSLKLLTLQFYKDLYLSILKTLMVKETSGGKLQVPELGMCKTESGLEMESSPVTSHVRVYLGD